MRPVKKLRYLAYFDGYDNAITRVIEHIEKEVEN